MRGLGGEIGAVIVRARRQFPDHQVDVAYRVCLPVYEVTLKVTEMAASDLSTTARFVLQIVQVGVAAADEIGRLMGLDSGNVTTAAGELLAANLVVQRGDQKIEITEEGKTVLRDGGRTLRPRNRHLKVAYDAATRMVLNMDTDRLLHREAVRERGLFVAPVGPRRPRVNNIPLEDVVEYDRIFGRRGRGMDGEILEVSAIRDVRLKYRDDVVVAKLDGAPPAKPLFAAYRAGQYLPEESTALERFAERGVNLVPEEHEQGGGRMPWAQSTVVGGEESKLLESIEVLDERILSTEQNGLSSNRCGWIEGDRRDRG